MATLIENILVLLRALWIHVESLVSAALDAGHEILALLHRM
jgi:hypothetical protein